MTNEEQREQEVLFEMCVEAWGLPAQAFQLAEECIELAHCAHKLARGRLHSMAALAEEIADVEIMIAEFKHTQGLQGQVDYYKHEKIERLKALVRKATGNPKSPESALRG